MKTSNMRVRLLVSLLFTCTYLKATFISNKETAINDHGRQKVVICHVAIWSVYRPDNGQFKLENLDPTLCTHVIFGYAHLNDTNDEIITFDSWEELLGNKSQDNIGKLKAKNPNLKALVCVGGWLDGSIKYSQMVANPNRRSRFVNNTVRFIRENNLDGLDLVWQYPAKRGGSIRDKENYIELLKGLRLEFDKYNFTLTACVGSSKDTIDYGYDVPKLSEYLDYMLLYTFDYHGWWSRVTGPNSPLKSSDFLNMEYAITYLLKLGAEPSKLILGVPIFARNFIFNNTDSFDKDKPQFGQTFIGQGFQGNYTAEEGYLGYNEVCLYLKNSPENWTVYWDNESYTPFAVFGDQMISFDDARSIAFKIRFALQNRLGGVFAFTADVDDFNGDCGERYPLLQTINKELAHYRYEVDIDDNKIHINEIKNISNVRYELSGVLYLALLVHLLVVFLRF